MDRHRASETVYLEIDRSDLGAALAVLEAVVERAAADESLFAALGLSVETLSAADRAGAKMIAQA